MILRVLASVLALGIFIYYYGFPHPVEVSRLLINITKGIFGFFVLSYLIRVILAIDSRIYLRESRFEGVLILFLMIDVVSVFVFNNNLLENFFQQFDIENFTPFYILSIQAYLLLLVGLEFVKFSATITSIKLKPATTFIYSFNPHFRRSWLAYVA